MKILIFIVLLIGCKKDIKLSIVSNYPITISVNKKQYLSDYFELQLTQKTSIKTSDSCHFTIKENDVIIWNNYTDNLDFKGRRKLEN